MTECPTFVPSHERIMQQQHQIASSEKRAFILSQKVYNGQMIKLHYETNL